jgi:hypothetical protein
LSLRTYVQHHHIHSPFCDPGTVCRSRLTRRPYLRAQPSTLRMYLHNRTPSKRVPKITQRPICSLPADLCQEGLACPGLDSPERDRQTNPVQSSTGYLSNILFRDKCVVVVFDLVETAVGCICSHEGTQSPFIHRAGVLLI